MKAVVIDDESKARNTLIKMIGLFCTDVDIIGQADSVESGKKLIEEKAPELIFLDIEMKDGSGIDLLRQIDIKQAQVIFVTGHNRYAVEAFRLSALDYLLKPIEPGVLVEAITKAKKRASQQLQYSIFMENMNLHNNQEKKIILKDAESIYIITVKDILRCQADGGYTHFFLQDQSQITTSTNLKEYEKLFAPFGFIRSHHSHLVNIQQVVRYDKADGGQLVMSDDGKVPVSFRKKEHLLKSLQNISENRF